MTEVDFRQVRYREPTAGLPGTYYEAPFVMPETPSPLVATWAPCVPAYATAFNAPPAYSAWPSVAPTPRTSTYASVFTTAPSVPSRQKVSSTPRMAPPVFSSSPAYPARPSVASTPAPNFPPVPSLKYTGRALKSISKNPTKFVKHGSSRSPSQLYEAFIREQSSSPVSFDYAASETPIYVEELDSGAISPLEFSNAFKNPPTAHQIASQATRSTSPAVDLAARSTCLSPVSEHVHVPTNSKVMPKVSDAVAITLTAGKKLFLLLLTTRVHYQFLTIHPWCADHRVGVGTLYWAIRQSS
jgi:hypothetical protein